MIGRDNHIDLMVLAELGEILEEGLNELLEEYLLDIPEQLQLLHAAIERNDVNAVTSISHSVKGSSGNLGITGLAQLCSNLEVEARSGGNIDFKAALADIETEFEMAKTAIEQYMAN